MTPITRLGWGFFDKKSGFWTVKKYILPLALKYKLVSADIKTRSIEDFG